MSRRRRTGSVVKSDVAVTPVNSVPQNKMLCPKCGAEMVLRVARKGNDTGQKKFLAVPGFLIAEQLCLFRAYKDFLCFINFILLDGLVRI